MARRAGHDRSRGRLSPTDLLFLDGLGQLGLRRSTAPLRIGRSRKGQSHRKQNDIHIDFLWRQVGHSVGVAVGVSSWLLRRGRRVPTAPISLSISNLQLDHLGYNFVSAAEIVALDPCRQPVTRSET